MRIIAGRLRGRQFEAPKGARTHPMSDKARGALFNMLGDLEDLCVLDAFAGSGAISFEASSRGAAHVTAIESDVTAQKIVAHNIELLGLTETVKLIKAHAGAWLRTNPGSHFDIIICDPPFGDLQPNLLERLSRRVEPKGLLVLSWPSDEEIPAFKDFSQIEHRKHGDMSLVFYRSSG